MKTSRLFLVPAFAALVPLGAAEKLNVLLIAADDLRTTLRCYGDAAARTPNLDRLAARGVRFERAYAQYPVCNPSRTSFMTGLRAEQTGVVGNTTLFRSLLPNIVTLPQLLRKNGWHATSYGKIFHAGGGGSEGRDAWIDTGKSWDEAALFQATPAGRVIEGRNLTGGKLKWCEWGMTGGTDDDQPDGQTAAHSIATIEKLAASGQPWIVGAGFHRPHDPFLVPKKYFELYPPGSLRLHHDPAGISPLPRLSLPGGDFAAAFGVFTDVERMEFLRAYYAGVSFTDAQVGRLMDALDRLKLWERTLVIFIGDHGYHHNERSWWNKNTLFERSCRVPCLVVAPGAKGGAVCRSLVELVDLYPTIADYCGVKAPHTLAGRSLRPLLENPAAPAPERDAAFTLVSRGAAGFGQTLRTDRWRYIQWSDGSSELYDHQVDLEEENNVASDPANASLLREFRARLQKTVPYRPSDSDGEGPATPKKKKTKKSN
ncbi:MAG: iduronate-2-sulfatase [Opitutus sp.]|nr:iduronate-2-sulfatase [Opitutus sp.]